MKRIYLDNAASTPVDERVLEAMLPYFQERYGNASSVHFFGQEAQSAVDSARKKVADFLNCSQSELFFTGSATEANNIAMTGTIKKFKKEHPGKKPHIIVSAIEHESILKQAKYNQDAGEADLDILPVSKDGIVVIEKLESLIREETVFISVMYVNNEIGTIQPIKEISQIIRKFNKEKGKNIVFHTDAVQATNFLNCDVDELGVDMLTISGHKIYGPKGVGALYIKKGTAVEPLVIGGEQELGVRSGTENVPAIVGIGMAVEVVIQEGKNTGNISSLRDALIFKILSEIPDAKVNGSTEHRIHNNINVSFKGVSNEDLLVSLDLKGIAASSGSACYSKSLKPSYVLSALGLSEEENRSSIRISIGRQTTKEDIEHTAKTLKEVVQRLRNHRS